MLWLIEQLKWIVGIKKGVVYTLLLIGCMLYTTQLKAAEVDIFQPRGITYYAGTEITLSWDPWEWTGTCYLRIINMQAHEEISIGYAMYEDETMQFRLPDDLVSESCVFQILDSIQYKIMGNSSYFSVAKLPSEVTMNETHVQLQVLPHPVREVLNVSQTETGQINLSSTTFDVVHVATGAIVLENILLPLNVHKLNAGVYALVPKQSGVQYASATIFIKQ